MSVEGLEFGGQYSPRKDLEKLFKKSAEADNDDEAFGIAQTIFVQISDNIVPPEDSARGFISATCGREAKYLQQLVPYKSEFPKTRRLLWDKICIAWVEAQEANREEEFRLALLVSMNPFDKRIVLESLRESVKDQKEEKLLYKIERLVVQTLQEHEEIARLVLHAHVRMAPLNHLKAVCRWNERD